MAFAPGVAGPHPLDAGAAAFADGAPGIGGLGIGIPGLGAGIGKNLNIDVGGGLFGGLPLGGLLGGFGGGVPYVPITPLGALEGFKGDLIVPIVIVGTAIFLLLIVVLAVKFALAFKMSLLKEKANKFKRDTTNNILGGGPPQEDELNNLAHMILTAIQTQSCAQNMICELGMFARDRQGLPSVLRILQSLVPTSLQGLLGILRDSVEGSFKCEVKYPCGGNQQQQPQPQQPVKTQ